MAAVAPATPTAFLPDFTNIPDLTDLQHAASQAAATLLRSLTALAQRLDEPAIALRACATLTSALRALPKLFAPPQPTSPAHTKPPPTSAGRPRTTASPAPTALAPQPPKPAPPPPPAPAPVIPLASEVVLPMELHDFTPEGCSDLVPLELLATAVPAHLLPPGLFEQQPDNAGHPQHPAPPSTFAHA